MSDLTLDNMTPVPRYRALNDAMVSMRGGKFRCNIKGIDEFYVEHDNVMLEACNTSFQIHFQVAPDEFARLYNLAQAVTAPVLAAAVNSPLLAEHRLWHETRVALFQHSVDDRSGTALARGQRPRVHFGDRVDRRIGAWRSSVRTSRATAWSSPGDADENPIQGARGAATCPKLRALLLHNGTVYRWNRACYGTKDGVAHLRIENRVLPAGPTDARRGRQRGVLLRSHGRALGGVRRHHEGDGLRRREGQLRRGGAPRFARAVHVDEGQGEHGRGPDPCRACFRSRTPV